MRAAQASLASVPSIQSLRSVGSGNRPTLARLGILSPETEDPRSRVHILPEQGTNFTQSHPDDVPESAEVLQVVWQRGDQRLELGTVEEARPASCTESSARACATCSMPIASRHRRGR
jgi:hypothetical protein